jgi:hypothetical protein
MYEQAFSCLTDIKNKDRNCLVEDELRVYYLKFDPEVSTYAARNKHRFHIKEVNFIFYFSLKNKTALDDIFVYIALMDIVLFSNLSVQHCQ